MHAQLLQIHIYTDIIKITIIEITLISDTC